MPAAVITGASRGLGLALARSLAADGWGLVVTARHADALAAAATSVGAVAVAGDVADAGHRRAVVDALHDLGGVDLVVNNASGLGPDGDPLPPLADYPLDAFEALFRANVVGPLGLIQATLALLAKSARGGRIVNVSSDAAVEGYEGWGGYGATKAALDQLTNVLAAEHPDLRVYSVDPGDLRTQMHQDAEPSVDLSHLPLPETVVPAFRRVIDGDLPSGRYRAAEL